tara:strand:+ start:195 stop:992 length:798 start_codon:yes stop_codon:yes gene_type:complete
MAATYAKRTPWEITRSVWYAMFMREALARTTGDRLAWFWMLAEPIAMVAIMATIRSYSMSGQQIFGADFVPWLITGMLGFFLFRENMMRSLGAINANKGLFSYRQVIPTDPIFVRCFVEGALKSFIFLLFVIAGSLLQEQMIPDHPLMAFWCWFSLWSLGLGIGLMLSALATLVPEIARVVQIISLPLLIISGAIMPMQAVPHELEFYILLNPILHGLESFRLAYFGSYHTLSGVSLTYLWLCTLSFMLIGLALQIRFKDRLKAK